MEGGIGILLLVIIAVVVGVLALALYLTGGTLWASGDKQDSKGARRPDHKRPTTPAHEKTEYVGTRDDG